MKTSQHIQQQRSIHCVPEKQIPKQVQTISCNELLKDGNAMKVLNWSISCNSFQSLRAANWNEWQPKKVWPYRITIHESITIGLIAMKSLYRQIPGKSGKSHCLRWFSDFSYSATSRSTFVIQSEISWELKDGLPWIFATDIHGPKRIKSADLRSTDLSRFVTYSSKCLNTSWWISSNNTDIYGS